MKTIPVLFTLLAACCAHAQAPPAPQPAGISKSVAPSDSELAEGIPVGRSDPGQGTAIWIATANGQKRKLASVPGTLGRTWVYVAVLMWADFPDMHSELRVPDPLPSFFVAMDQTPRNRLFLVRCRVNRHTRDRSVKMGQAGFITYRGISAPDADWTVPFDAIEMKPGLWKVTPKEALPPGEYGFFSGAAAAHATKGNPIGELFDFAVDNRS